MYLYCRYAYSGDATVGYASNAWQRAAALFLRLLHLWNRRSSVVGWAAETQMRSQTASQRLHRRVISTKQTSHTPKYYSKVYTALVNMMVSELSSQVAL